MDTLEVALPELMRVEPTKRQRQRTSKQKNMVLAMNISCQAAHTWRPSKPKHNQNRNGEYIKRKNFRKDRNLPNTLSKKGPYYKKSSSFSPLQPCEPLPELKLQTEYDQSHALPHQRKYWTRQHTINNLAETLHQNQKLMSLLDKLEEEGSNPVEILEDDGDWSTDHFWAVVRYLKNVSRAGEIHQVFDIWKNVEKSRINEANYEKIVTLLAEECLVDEAMEVFREMKNHGFALSLSVHNLIIHGFAGKGKFDYAQSCLDEMNQMNLVLDTETYDGLIQAYGKHGMYDEIIDCVKRMEATDCLPDQVTYNILIQEFTQGGLINRMERVYQTLRSKQMDLQSTTLVAMLEAYINFGPLDKMEKFYRRVLNSQAPLKDDLVRKLAGVYIDNYMFSKLDELGLDLSTRTGTTDIVWCLRLLSSACLSSRKGIDSILGGMAAARVPWNITFVNIILLTYLKMKDFTHLRTVMYELPDHNLQPDMVTFGILFDSIGDGFDGTDIMNAWKRIGYFSKAVEMDTDPLVLLAFGKGHFLGHCEKFYASLKPENREGKIWSYQSIIELVIRKGGSKF